MSSGELPAGVTPDLLGTDKHPSARDMSRFLVHLTNHEEGLGSILGSGRLEARKPHGFTSKLFMVEDAHRSTCLSEIPLNELGRLTDRFGSYGLVFTKEFVRQAGGQRVWYLDDESAPLESLHRIKRKLIEERDWANDFWAISPFIDIVKPGVYAWEHEREWRVAGNLEFQWSDLALVIAPEGSELGIQPGSAGIGVYDPADDEVTWWGDEPAALSVPVRAAAELLAERFGDYWVGADDAGIFYDSSEGGYQSAALVIYDLFDAVDSQYQDLPEYLRGAIRHHLADHVGPYVMREEFEQLESDNHRRRLEEEPYS